MEVLSFHRESSKEENMEKILAAYDNPNCTSIELGQDQTADDRIMSAITELIVSTFNERQWNNVKFHFGYEFEDEEAKRVYDLAGTKESEWRDNIFKTLELRGDQMEAKAISGCWGGSTGGHSSYTFQNTPIADQGMTSFHCACRDGKLQDLISIWQEEGTGNEINLNGTTKNYQWTPLHLACANGHLKIVQFLVEKGANIHVRNSHGSTPLHDAVANGHVEVARFLLDYGVDVNIQHCGNQKIPIQVASMDNIEIFRLLVTKGADVNVKPTSEDMESDYLGRKASLLHSAADVGKIEILELLLQHGADMNVTGGPWDRTPIFCTFFQLEAMRVFVTHGVDTTFLGKDGMSVLMDACKSGILEPVRCLMESGADIELRGSNGNTPLMYAATYVGGFEVIPYLVEKGANVVQVTNKKGETPLHLACASRHDNMEMIKYFLELGVDVNATSNTGETVLHVAAKAEFDNVQLVGFLVEEHGMDVNAKSNSGETPLHSACCGKETDNKNVALYLLEHGADMNAKDEEGKTPLQWALDKCPECVRLLVQQGAEGADDSATLECLAGLEG